MSLFQTLIHAPTMNFFHFYFMNSRGYCLHFAQQSNSPIQDVYACDHNGSPWIFGTVPLALQNPVAGLPLQSSFPQHDQYDWDINGNPCFCGPFMIQGGMAYFAPGNCSEWHNFVSKPESIMSQSQTSARPSGFSYSVCRFRFRNRIVMPMELWLPIAT